MRMRMMIAEMTVTVVKPKTAMIMMTEKKKTDNDAKNSHMAHNPNDEEYAIAHSDGISIPGTGNNSFMHGDGKAGTGNSNLNHIPGNQNTLDHQTRPAASLAHDEDNNHFR